MNSVFKLYFLFSLCNLSDGNGTKYKTFKEHKKHFSTKSIFIDSDSDSSPLRRNLRKLSGVLISEMLVRKRKGLRSEEVSENFSQLPSTKMNGGNLLTLAPTVQGQGYKTERRSFRDDNRHLHSSRNVIALSRFFQRWNPSLCQSHELSRDQRDVVGILCRWIKSSANYTGSPVPHTGYTTRKVKRNAGNRLSRSLSTRARRLNQATPEGSLRHGMPPEKKIPGFVTQRGGRVLRISMKGKIRGVRFNEVDAFCVIRPIVSLDENQNLTTKLQGVRSRFYVAMNEKYRLYTTKDPSDRNTDFFHEYKYASHDAFLSKIHGSYIGFQANGRPVKHKVVATNSTRLKHHLLSVDLRRYKSNIEQLLQEPIPATKAPKPKRKKQKTRISTRTSTAISAITTQPPEPVASTTEKNLTTRRLKSKRINKKCKRIRRRKKCRKNKKRRKCCKTKRRKGKNKKRNRRSTAFNSISNAQNIFHAAASSQSDSLNVSNNISYFYNPLRSDLSIFNQKSPS